jgi:hypothetical protein
MPRVGFEPTTSVFQWANMVHALDRVATAIGLIYYYIVIKISAMT